jgi:hypothetical protein
MGDAIIWLVTYDGQNESVYTWTARDYDDAVYLMTDLKIEYPDRVWNIIEKDVS